MTAALRIIWSENGSLPSLYDGWSIEIFGCEESINLRPLNYVWTGSAPFNSKKDTTGEYRVFGTGPEVWILLPDKEPNFRKDKGAKRHQPPFAYASLVLEELHKLGYEVHACNSDVSDNKLNQKVIIVVALTKN